MAKDINIHIKAQDAEKVKQQLDALAESAKGLVMTEGQEFLQGYNPDKRTIMLQQIAEIPVDKRDAAIRRAGIVREFEQFAGHTIREGGTRTEAISIFCAQRGIPIRTLQSWIAKFREGDVLGLVDTRGRAGELRK